MPIPHPGGDYSVTITYALPDDAWCLELVLVPEQRILVIATVPDEDPDRPATVCFDSAGPHVEVPWDVMRWFTEQVEHEISTSRAWMQLRPELVAVIHELRQDHLGCIADEDFATLLPDIRAAVPAADLPAVLHHAFGRMPDGGFTAAAGDQEQPG